jgi:hypothetical protein
MISNTLASIILVVSGMPSPSVVLGMLLPSMVSLIGLILGTVASAVKIHSCSRFSTGCSSL